MEGGVAYCICIEEDQSPSEVTHLHGDISTAMGTWQPPSVGSV